MNARDPNAVAPAIGDTADEREAIAHVLRRCTFGPDPSQVDEILSLGLSPEDLCRLLISHAADPSIDAPFDAPVLDVPPFDGEDDESDLVQQWWLDQMIRSRTGLHERLTWFWHGHFTTSLDKAPPHYLASQLADIRRLAAGNFRDLAKAVVTGGAMLLYLDSSGSNGSDPNENLARELMELYLLGHGTYTESDVRQVARSLSGWWVDWEGDETGYDAEAGYPGVVEILGQRGRFSATDVVDLLCDQPSCARHVATKMYEWLVGTVPTEDRIGELADTFRSGGLDILPLVQAIVEHPEFHNARRSRPKQPIEWLVPTARSLKIEGFEPWEVEILGQVPFRPPTPAGWPHGQRWRSPGQILMRLNLLNNREWEQTFGFNEADPIPDVLAHCGVFELSEPTLAALDEAFWAPLDPDWANRLLLTLIVTSPEYALA